MWSPSLIAVCAVQEGCTDKERLPGCMETPCCTRLNLLSRGETKESSGTKNIAFGLCFSTDLHCTVATSLAGGIVRISDTLKTTRH